MLLLLSAMPDHKIFIYIIFFSLNLYNLKQRTYPFNQRVPGIRKNKKKEEAAAHTHTPDERGTLTHKQHT